ncbi:haloacid dehalogenase type II [Micromonospora sp. NPDC050417]|uniref:haloacid dehalogenase type II n=1 Tax=Micromonospora sp. NPDC050417 TaxID=3364280 RepID=UPI0037AEBF56
MAGERRRVGTLLFDVLGTLVDETGSVADEVGATLAGAGSDPSQSTRLSREWARRISEQQRLVNSGEIVWTSQDQIRRATINEIAAEHGIPLDRPALERLATVGHRLRRWPDSATALASLAERFVTVALSDADLSTLADLSRQGGLRWHCVLSGELVRAYKPHPAVYRLALRMLRLDPSRTMMVATHPWDLRAAAEHGLMTAYVARPGGTAPDPTDQFDIVASDLADLASQLPTEVDAVRR